ARELGTDLFGGRVLGRPTIFMTGPGAAELFYDSARFRRAGAVPARVQKTLIGSGGVQTLDGPAHRARKALFMQLMTRENMALFRALSARSWAEAIDDWTDRARVSLFEEARFVLCRAACTWAGVPVSAERARQLAGWVHDMVDGFASIGQRSLRARWARRRAESWACRVIADVRHGRRQPPPMTAARVFAEADANGRRLPLRVAAVELLNIVRPITAIAWWVAFLALALRDHAPNSGALAHDNALLESFVQEVRRFYPFTPFLGARPSHAFEWRGAKFEPRQLVLLDVYGTLHDPRLWEQPEQFRAQRFIGREPTPFDLIPNGGGDFMGGHRCAGEQMTIDALCQAAHVLVREVEYALPPQDLSFSLARIPTRPASGVLLEGVRRRAGRPQRLELALQRDFDGRFDTAGPVSH
ncbi:MAG TPA: cytochrome P450, partial [Polyangiaceae bacterium]|nr:cytochrome P450 [Polyangiaceae bacterium]